MLISILFFISASALDAPLSATHLGPWNADQSRQLRDHERNLYTSVAELDYGKVRKWVDEHGEPNVGAGSRMPLLHYASAWRSMTALLLRLGAEPTIVDERGNTVAHFMWQRPLKGTSAQVRLSNLIRLVRSGLDINTPNGMGDTVLHVVSAPSSFTVASIGSFSDVAVILSLGGLVDATNNLGFTPLDVLVTSEQLFDKSVFGGPPSMEFYAKAELMADSLERESGGLDKVLRSLSITTADNRPYVEEVVDVLKKIRNDR